MLYNLFKKIYLIVVSAPLIFITSHIPRFGGDKISIFARRQKIIIGNALTAHLTGLALEIEPCLSAPGIL